MFTDPVFLYHIILLVGYGKPLSLAPLFLAISTKIFVSYGTSLFISTAVLAVIVGRSFTKSLLLLSAS